MHRYWTGLVLFLLSGFFISVNANETKNVGTPNFEMGNQAWDKKEIVMLSSYWLASVIDAGQTLYGLKNGAHELNPFLGRKPGKAKIYGIKLGLGTIASLLCHYSARKDRKYMLGLMNTIQWSAVIWNGKFAGVGLRMQF